MEYAPIRLIPDEVAAQIKSSATISSLEYVVVELFKNALDAGSGKVDVNMDSNRGACTVEDDGLGIHPDEFLETGGLGKAFHTSKNNAASSIHGGEGTFLASLAAMSILKITSHHHTNRSTESLLYHYSKPTARLKPVHGQYQLLSRDHGTKVEVHDLFGNMPVRVKQRGLEASNQREKVREWESLRRALIGLLLAWHVPVDAVISHVPSGRKIVIRSKGTGRHHGHVGNNDTSKVFDLERIRSLLSQANYLEPEYWDTWIKMSARTPCITIRGAFSLQPMGTKQVQFISLGIRSLNTGSGANVLYDEVNRIFLHSSFGSQEASSNYELSRRRRSDDGRYKKDGHTIQQLRGAGKGVDRWPMFVLRIDLQEGFVPNIANRDVLEHGHALSGITKVLGAMVTGFLNDHHFRPRKNRKRSRPVSTSQRHSPSTASASADSPDVIRSALVSGRHGRGASTSDRDTLSGQDLLGYTVQMPKFRMDRVRYADEQSEKWSRIKGSARQSVVNAAATVSKSPLRSSNDICASALALQSQTTSRNYDTTRSGAVDRYSQDGVPRFGKDEHGLESQLPAQTYDGALPDKTSEDTFIWTNPITKETVFVHSRTGLVLTRTQQPSSVATGQRRPDMGTSHTVKARLSNPELDRCTPASKNLKPGSWVGEFLQEWKNPVFSLAIEQDIPRVSFDESSSEVHSSANGKGHGCSHFDLEKTSSSDSYALSSKLSKTGLGQAKVISQIDKKFVLVVAAACPPARTESPAAESKQSILVVIDQHAADERSRVEALLTDLCTLPTPEMLLATSLSTYKPAVAITLLPKPLIFQIKHQEHPMFTAEAQYFANWGILYDLELPCAGPVALERPPCKVIVKALPPVIAERCRLEPKVLIELLRREIWSREEAGTTALGRCLPSSANWSKEERKDDKDLDWLTRISTCPQGLLDMLYSRSCRSAIMFNDELSLDECGTLVTRLVRCRFPFQCAHGRPSMIPLVALGDGLPRDNNHISGENFIEDGLGDETGEPFVNAWRRWRSEKGR